ncbi:MAG: bifunctional riboflavin kinase/FAD synthetase, partial [Beijerinckiaceae bacterium]
MSQRARAALILHDPETLPGIVAHPVLAIGNFDGVHRGHQAVIARTRALAKSMGRPAGIMTFEPHPISLFRPDDPPFRLTPPPLKEEFLAVTGLDLVIVMTFDSAFAGTDARAFEDDLLHRRLAVSAVIAGHDFHYGNRRGGSPATLQAAGARLGYAVEIVAPVGDGGAVI